MEVVKIKCFLVCRGLFCLTLFSEADRPVQTLNQSVWSWARSRAGILFMSASRRPTSTRLNGFLWQLGIFMAPFDSMGFAAETEGSSEGGTATIHCRCSKFQTQGKKTLSGILGRFNLWFSGFKLELISILKIWWLGLFSWFILSLHYVQTLQGVVLCSANF